MRKIIFPGCHCPDLSKGVVIAALAAALSSAILGVSSESAGFEAQGVQSNDTILHVIHISVDGLRPDAVTNLGPQNLPHFYRFRVEGAFTDNARTDYDFTNTLPNHVCMVTSRGVNGPEGHNVNFNSDNGSTIAAAHGSYVAGVFDVVHDRGMSTALYASKDKVGLIDRSYNGDNGAPDTIGADDGRDKIDTYVNQSNTELLMDAYRADMAPTHYAYSFIHITDPDNEGHSSGWMSFPYYFVIVKVDRLIGQIFDLIDGDPLLRGRTAVILTADHGGTGDTHGDETVPGHYTIPYYVWGPGIPAGADLYALNQSSRFDPGMARPDYQSPAQPIRDGDAGNLALDLLGLDPIPGSTIDASYDLGVSLPGGGALPAVLITSPPGGATFSALDTIAIEVTASAGTGSIVKIEFFVNWNKLGEDDIYPYRYDWKPVPAGIYTITARAVRDDGFASTTGVDVEIASHTGIKEESSVDWREQGRHTARLTSKELSPCLYVYQLRVGDNMQAGKLMVLR